MITGRGRFNLYLLLALTLIVAGGCRTNKDNKKKQFATLRIHLEAGAQDTDREVQVPIYRAHPFQLQVQNEPFLTEAQVASAKVVDALGGFDLQIQFDRQGTWLLQQYSANNRGRHFALFSEFSKKGEKGKEGRWLAAPEFSTLISTGLIQFTPDTSREEAEQIALGLSNIAKKNQADMKW
jgi:preprotein translocase subunit SecD